ncbi:MAG: Uma2 family endonuclease [Cyanobacteria bacterium J06597_16]
MVTLQLRQIKVLPGQSVVLEDVDWPEFEQILTELGDRRNTRISYTDRTLTIGAPLYAHESFKITLGDLVKVLLEELDINYAASGSTTLKRQDLGKGAEPDDSFYIQNCGKVLGKKRIDLNVDPPPDLAIEIDLTSKTDIEIYEALGVSELWRFDEGALRIDVLQKRRYVQTQKSLNFPDWPIADLAVQYIEKANAKGQGHATKEFRKWVRSRLNES